MAENGTGPTDDGYRLIASVLVIASIVCWVVFNTEGGGWWLAASMLTTVWSAACAVLCGIKGLDDRLAATVESSSVDPLSDA